MLIFIVYVLEISLVELKAEMKVYDIDLTWHELEKSLVELKAEVNVYGIFSVIT